MPSAVSETSSQSIGPAMPAKGAMVTGSGERTPAGLAGLIVDRALLTVPINRRRVHAAGDFDRRA
jgi:hypothetical protein